MNGTGACLFVCFDNMLGLLLKTGRYCNGIKVAFVSDLFWV